MSAVTASSAVSAAIAAIPDPEVPVVTIEDLGILRAVAVDEARGAVTVTITPTYSGCPAMEAIERQVLHVAGRHGLQAQVRLQLDPPWTTDWMSESGKQRLREFGIAPPTVRVADADPAAVALVLRRRVVSCPQCGSTDTEELARFGSTACKALRRCNDCREPFDEFKAI